jgi:hypothetical protein
MALVNIESFRTYLWPLVLIMTGIASLVSAGYYWKQTDTFLANAVEATGEVIVMRGEDRHIQLPRQLAEVEETYRPVIQFSTGEGHVVRIESIVSSYPPRYAVGDKVRVLYDPNHPADARIDDFIDLWSRPAFAAGAGLILAVLGAASLHSHHKHGWKRTRQGYYRGER